MPDLKGRERSWTPRGRVSSSAWSAPHLGEATTDHIATHLTRAQQKIASVQRSGKDHGVLRS
jgi:hypothetical protein